MIGMRDVRACLEGCGIIALGAIGVKWMGFGPLLALDYRGSVVATFARTLVVPGFVEEAIWRRTFLRSTPSALSTKSLLVNAGFAASHVVTGLALASLRPGAPALFWDPAFLVLALAFGIACTHAYVRAGHRIAAPVIVHALAVTVWLRCLGGERLLSGSSVAPQRPESQRGTS